MTGTVGTFGPPPVRHPCTDGIEVFDLTSLVTLHDSSMSDLPGFCHWASQVIGQGVHFIGGTYANQGYGPRNEWAFWAPIRSPSGDDGEVIFVARKEGKVWRYQVFFYGDVALRLILTECVLHSGVGEGGGYRSIIGRPWPRDDDGRLVTYFEVLVSGKTLHSLSMKSATQFD